PSLVSAPTIRRVVSLIGTASPSPTPATAVLIPTTRPTPSARAPPELPGFSAASVWITLSTIRVVEPGARRQRPPERGDDARGDRAGEAVRVPDRDDELPDLQRLGVAELGGNELVRLGAEDGEVGEGVGADHLDRQLPPVDERRHPACRSLDDVGGGEHEAVLGDHHSAAAAVDAPPAAEPARDAQVRDRGREPARHLGDDTRVRVERG